MRDVFEASRNEMTGNMKNRKDNIVYNLMMMPGVILLMIFSIAPMFGIVIAFERFYPTKGIFGSEWIGMQNILFMFQLPDSKQIFANTIIISFFKIIGNLVVPATFAILLSEIRAVWYKKNRADGNIFTAFSLMGNSILDDTWFVIHFRHCQ